jgi:uncharacterized protein (DUF2384 family)
MERALVSRSLKGVTTLPKAAAVGSETEMANYRKLVERAVEVFGDEIKASEWLSRPSNDLGGEVPIRVAEREAYGLFALEPIFIRIEHGIDY